MEPSLLTESARQTAAILLLSLVAVESGGLYMMRVVAGRHPLTDFQKAFSRAGHAHAGVLVTLGLVAQVLVSASGMSGVTAFLAGSGTPLAAILMPAGFFFSSAGNGATRPNRLVVLIYAGAVSLAAGAIALGVGLLV